MISTLPRRRVFERADDAAVDAGDGDDDRVADVARLLQPLGGELARDARVVLVDGAEEEDEDGDERDDDPGSVDELRRDEDDEHDEGGERAERVDDD
jgi:hypothetical protein